MRFWLTECSEGTLKLGLEKHLTGQGGSRRNAFGALRQRNLQRQTKSRGNRQPVLHALPLNLGRHGLGRQEPG